MFGTQRSKQRKLQEMQKATMECGRTTRAAFAESCGMQQCSPKVYAEWLSAFITGGGRVTRFFTSMPWQQYSQATREPTKALPCLYGANSVNLVVPKGMRIYAGARMEPRDFKDEWGHNRVCAFEGNKAWVSDPKEWIECSPEVIALLDMSQRQWRALEVQLGQYEQREFKSQCSVLRYQLVESRAFRPEALTEETNDFSVVLDRAESQVTELRNLHEEKIAELRKSHAEFMDCIRQNHNAILSMMR